MSTYIPKIQQLGPSRIQKICKDLLSDAQEDRRLALEANRLFRTFIDQNPTDAVSKNLLVETLKVAQQSKQNVIKALQLLVKIDAIERHDKTKVSGKSSPENIFTALDKLVDND